MQLLDKMKVPFVFREGLSGFLMFSNGWNGPQRTWRFNKRGESPLLHASAKSNVGHEEANAGTCGFIKAPLPSNEVAGSFG